MGTVNKDSPAYQASAALRQFARETANQYLANVVRFMDSRLQYFINWVGTCQEGAPDHLSWIWCVETELRDLTYLGFIPERVFHPIHDLLQKAIDQSREVRQRRYESGDV